MTSTWADERPAMKRQIYSSHTKTRLDALRRVRDLAPAPPDPQWLPDVVELLLGTYSYYVDPQSRNSVVDTLEALAATDASVVAALFAFVAECAHRHLAITSYLTLLHWINQFLARAPNAAAAAEAHAAVVDGALSHTAGRTSKHLHRIHRGVVHSAAHAVAAASRNRDYVAEARLDAMPVPAALCYWGVCAEAGVVAPEQAAAAAQWYADAVVLAKAAPPAHALAAFGPLVRQWTPAQFEVVVPSAEKAVMRSQENAWGAVLPPLLESVAFDMSPLVGTKVFASMVAGLKSAKPAVAAGAARAAAAVVPSVHAAQAQLVDELAKALKASSAVDAKAAVGRLFGLVAAADDDARRRVLRALDPSVAKDQNEVSLAPAAAAYVRHLVPEAPFVATVAAGLADKKAPLKRVWFNAVATLKDVPDALRAPLQAALDDAVASPMPTLANRLMGAAYVALALGCPPPALGGDKCILTSPKVYTKLAGPEVAQYTRALAGVDSVAPEYAAAWVWLATSASVGYPERLAAVAALSRLLDTRPGLVAAVGDAVEAAVVHPVPEMATQPRLVPPVLAALTQVADPAVAEQAALRSLVVANHPAVQVTGGWIGLMQRSTAAHDIAAVVLEHHEAVVAALVARSREFVAGSLNHAAVVASVALVAFVLPEPVAPAVVAVLRAELAAVTARLDAYDATTIGIWRHRGDEPFVDVTAPEKQADKNSRDYETQQWEASLKKELKKKKTLTRDEQAAQKAQVAREAEVRAEVEATRQRGLTVLAVVGELLATARLNVDNGVGHWYAWAVPAVLALARHPGSAAVFGDEPVARYLALSALQTARLGAARESVGVATLKMLDVPVPERFHEPVTATVGRLLYRVKMLSDAAPLDTTTWVYWLPLVVEVLELGQRRAVAAAATRRAVTSEFVDEDPEEEHLLLALELVSTHAACFSGEVVLPRTPVLRVVVALMKVAARAKLAKECYLSLAHYIGIAPLAEDLAVLLGAVIVPEVYVKATVLEGLDTEFDLHADGMTTSLELWIAAHDNDEVTAQTAATVWSDSQFALPATAPADLLGYFGQRDAGMRVTVARAFVAAARGLGSVATAVDQLIAHVSAHMDAPAPEVDKFGLVVKSAAAARDPWETRSTAALALKSLAPAVAPEDVTRVFRFLVESGTLGDRVDVVRQEMLDAATTMIAEKGRDVVDALKPVIDACLTAPDTKTRAQDQLRQSTVVCYGALAQHLTGEPLYAVVDRMLATLDTPSEDVQLAICQGIAPLVGPIGARFGEYMDATLTKMLDPAVKMPQRRGAAYGVAGLVHGYGIRAMAEFDVVRTLMDAADDRKHPEARESVSFAFETLSQALGKFFEPYVIAEVLPVLLRSLGDQVPEVRDATDDAARQIMKNTTSYGIKKLIPVAIRTLDDTAWRSKKGAVELLGNMAYLDPTQLSASLSAIIPEIVGALNDTHKEVRKAADASLKKFGDVIRNPEIQAVVPALLAAIGDPTAATETALDRLIGTQFVHYIDGPSLALIIHVIHRGMRDRSAAVKKKACQIVGNMAILVDSRDLDPYLGQLVAELEEAMVDPVPATRSTAARALGSLVEKLGEAKFPELVPSLLAALNDPSRTGDRLGSAQALAEVTCGLGVAKLDELMPTILAGATSPRAHVRAGFMPLLLYLPVCFGTQFAPYLARIIPPILTGLADTDDDVCDTALRAGRLIVHNYATRAVDLLLPELEKGLSDDNHRIRLSSLQLTGDLLFQITGITGKTELEDDGASSGEITQALVDSLGPHRRNQVLAALFVCRSDVAGVVRAAAIDIWNALVGNTPKTIKQIMPELIHLIVVRLASADPTHRKIAATCLGDMVRRVGANALAQLLPTLRHTLETTDDADSKQGICIATTELVRSASREALAEYQPVFVAIVALAVVDPAPGVRAAAAEAFEALQEELGSVVVDEIVPKLLAMLASDDKAESHAGLSALQDLMAAQAHVIFPILMPTLLAAPVTPFKAQALASLAKVAGPALYKRLPAIIGALVDTLVADPGAPEPAAALDAVMLAVDDDGAHPLMAQVMALIKHEDAAKRAVIYARCGPFFAATTLNYSQYTADLVGQFVLSLGDKDPQVVAATHAALVALVKAQPKEQLGRLIKPTFQALELTGVAGEDLAGFALPKGPAAVLPVFSHGLMYGSADAKEMSARGMADVISKTPAASLKPFATTITGPLIRVVGEKVAAPVKVAILHALNNLLLKIPQFLRPFVPQLQRTFVRSLSDSSRELRARAVECLRTLIGFQPRVDALVTELVAGAAGATDAGVKTAMLQAMLAVVEKSGAAMSEASKASVLALVEEQIAEVDDAGAVAFAELMGAVAQVVSADEAASILRAKVLDKPGNDTDKFSILAVNSFLKYAPSHIFGDPALLAQIVALVVASAAAPVAFSCENAVVAIGKLMLGGDVGDSEPALAEALALAALAPASSSATARRLALVVVRTVARLNHPVVARHLDVVVPSVFGCLRDRVIPIKLAAEKAYLAVFDLVNDASQAQFHAWFDGKTEFKTVTGDAIVPRSIGDYTTRVAARLASAEREKIEAGGDADQMFSDQFEDEKEVWSVGV
ncbi:eIF-2-alpha kinase activator Gcn1p [Diutina catenulata]